MPRGSAMGGFDFLLQIQFWFAIFLILGSTELLTYKYKFKNKYDYYIGRK